ncbi:MAG: hypothetical protein WDN69_04570 [Aliidongia sp.]
MFETADGVEILNCSGLPEAFSFEAADESLSARPTLSVLTRSDRAVRAAVTLSYLAQNFDWAADYVATLAPDGRTLDLGAWITLANGNGIGFPDSRTQIVAGVVGHRPSRDPADDVAGPWGQGRVVADCVPPVPVVGVPPSAAPPPAIALDMPPPMAMRMDIDTKIIEEVALPPPGATRRFEALPHPAADHDCQPAGEAGPAARPRRRAGRAHLCRDAGRG